MHNITLCMIVKNENHEHFRTCLDSIFKYIDYWVINDNGSTDGTQQFIKDYFAEKGIPGELNEVEWKGFGETRTEALRACDGKAKWILMIDADDYIKGELPIDQLDDQVDGYGVFIRRGDFQWWRNQIFKTGVGWKYTGILHEYAECPPKQADSSLRTDRLKGDYFLDARTLGARNINEDGTPLDHIKKYSRDAETLVEALKEEPENARYQFYLAQSYFDSHQCEKAEEAYAKRATLGGWIEEVYYSIFRVAVTKLLQNKPWMDAQDTFLQAWNVKPDRAEALYEIARVHRLNGNPRLGYMFSKHALEIPFPENDILFLSRDVYDWKILDEFASTAFYMGDIENGYTASKKLVELLGKQVVPEEHRERIVGNLSHYEGALNKYKQSKIEEAQREFDAKKSRQEMQKKTVAKKKKQKSRKSKQRA